MVHASESHTNNSLKTNMAFAQFLGPRCFFYDVKTKEEIIAFLDTKIKSVDEDPDRKCITTWNDYLNDIKYFFRWLYNNKKKKDNEYKEKDEIASLADWETPSFANIKKKKTKRLSPYIVLTVVIIMSGYALIIGNSINQRLIHNMLICYPYW